MPFSPFQIELLINTMGSRILIYSLLVLLFGVICVSVYRHIPAISSINADAISNLVSAPQPQKIEILYAEQGFVPSTTSIAVGNTVIFTNTVDLPLWVASDPHPLHSDYNEFDSEHSIGKGESYEFTF